MNSESLKRIVGAAVSAPSGDNCQPFQYRWDGTTLQLFHLPERGVHRLNFAGFASLIALGASIKSIEIAATADGLHTDIKLLPHGFSEGVSWADLSFRPGATPHSLLNALEKRATDRRLYKGGSPEDAIFRKVGDCAKDSPSCGIHFIGKVSETLLHFLQEVDELAWTDRRAHEDLMKWIRFSQADAVSTRDGMTLESLGINKVEAKLLKQCRKWSVQSMMNKLGFIKNMHHLIHKQIESSAGLVLFTVKGTDPKDLVEAGRIALHTWLLLNERGFGVQPLTLGSLPVYAASLGKLDSDTPDRFQKLFRAGLATLKEAFRVPDGETPVWMIRTGESSPLPHASRTYRLPVDDVLRS